MKTVFAERTRNMKSSAIRELLKVTERPEIISFGGGLPAPGCFPVAEVKNAFDRVLDGTDAADALQYSTTEGYLPLRRVIVNIMASQGCPVSEDAILITNGSQQALDLLGKVLIDPGDVILVENPTYMGALQAFNSYEPQYEAVDSDQHGMVPEALEKILDRCQPKMAYLAPTFQNPTGRTMTADRRIRVMEILNRHGVLLVEDDPYYELYYNGQRPRPLKALDKTEGVVYLSTFSKTLAPAFRLGWAAASPSIIERLVQAKQGSDLNSGALVQRAMTLLMTGPELYGHLEKLRREYRLRRDAMLAAMADFFPPGVAWSRPEGGMFVWVELPSAVDTERLLPDAVDLGVAYVPGNAFFAVEPCSNCMRLNYSNASPEEIREGIRRLGALFARHLPSPQAGHVV